MVIFRSYKINLVLLFSLPIVFVFLFGIWGYDLTDNPYMRGYAYSLMHGKRMYLDLFSRLPPGGYLLQKWFYTLVGDFYPIFLNRFFFYFNNSLIAFLMAVVIDQRNYFKHRPSITCLQFLLFLIMINNFPASMGYAHVSMFLGALSILLIYFDLFLLAGIILAFSMFTKQTFAAFVILIPVVMFFKKSRKVNYMSFFLGLSLTSVFVINYFFHDLPFLHKMTLRHTLGAVFRSGFSTYFKFGDISQVVGCIFVISGMILFKGKRIIRRMIFLASLCGLYFFKKSEIDGEVLLSLHQVHKFLLITSFIILLRETYRIYKGHRNIDNELIFYGVLFLLSWVSGLNDAGSGPVFLPALFLIPYRFLIEERSFDEPVLLEFTVFYFLITVMMNVNAYRDGSRLNMGMHLGEIDPRYSLIYTNKEKFSKIKELVELKKKEKKVIALPTFSDANFLLRQLNCLPTVWDVATGLSNPGEKLMNKVRSSIIRCADHTYLLEKGITRRYTLYTPMIPELFHRVGETEYFEIYKGLRE